MLASRSVLLQLAGSILLRLVMGYPEPWTGNQPEEAAVFSGARCVLGQRAGHEPDLGALSEYLLVTVLWR